MTLPEYNRSPVTVLGEQTGATNSSLVVDCTHKSGQGLKELRESLLLECILFGPIRREHPRGVKLALDARDALLGDPLRDCRVFCRREKILGEIGEALIP